jgi:hypothetical protein
VPACSVCFVQASTIPLRAPTAGITWIFSFQVLRERGGRADEEDEEIEDSFEGDQGMEALGGSRGLGTGDDWLDEYLPEESRKEW